MRGYRPTGELDEEEDLRDDRSRRPSPGKVTRTMRMEGMMIARRSSNDGAQIDTSGVQSLVERSRGGGSALPDSLRGTFEESLGARLADVRVHTDAQSAGVAGSIAAKAFTVGQDIYFGAGQYDPASKDGKHLIAHEVAHTVQQAGGGTQVHTKLEVSSAGDAIESEADRAAEAMMAGQKASVSAAPVNASRTEDPAATAQPAGPADANAGATQNADKPNTVVVTIVPSTGKMEFDATDYLELYKQVSARAASNACAGQCTCGVDQDYSAIDKYKITITVKLETAVPTWKQRSTAKPEHQAKFDAWAASVKKHEDAHYKKYADAYATLKTKMVKCTSQADCEVVFKEVDTAVEADQAAFDANKANQPAPLDIPGGVEKINSTPGAKPNATDDGAAEPAAS